MNKSKLKQIFEFQNQCLRLKKNRMDLLFHLAERILNPSNHGIFGSFAINQSDMKIQFFFEVYSTPTSFGTFHFSGQKKIEVERFFFRGNTIEIAENF